MVDIYRDIEVLLVVGLIISVSDKIRRRNNDVKIYFTLKAVMIN